MRPKGVADGRQANIPAHARRVRGAASEKGSGGGQRLSPGRAGRRVPRVRLAGFKAMRPRFPEKRCATDVHPVPKPTQVGGYRHTKARERNLVKELGNIAP